MSIFKTRLKGEEPAVKTPFFGSSGLPVGDVQAAIERLLSTVSGLGTSITGISSALAGTDPLLGASSAVFPSGRIPTATSTISWDMGTSNQAKANVPDGAITFAKMQILPPEQLIGRPHSTSGAPVGISLDSQTLSFSGITLQRAAISGDVGIPAASSTATIQPGVVSFAKMQNLSSSYIVMGRRTVGAGSPEELGLASGGTLGLEIQTTNIVRSAFAGGDVTAPLGSAVLTISNTAVTFAKMQNLTSSNRALGRFTAGAGSIEELQLVSGRGGPILSGSNLVTDAFTGDVTKSSGVSTTAISTGVVTYAKIQNLPSSNLVLGRFTAGAGSAEELQLVSGRGGPILSGSNIVTDAFKGAIIKGSGTSETSMTATLMVVLGRGTMPVGPVSGAEVSMPCSGTFTKWTMLSGGVSGTLIVDIWKDTFANFPPTVADTITASAKPTIIGASVRGTSTGLTGWAVSFQAGDIFRFNVDSVAAISYASLALDFTKTS